MAANLIAGLSIGEFNERAQELRDAQRAADRHRILRESKEDPQVRADQERVEQLLEEIGPMRGRASFHKLFGIAAAIVAMLVNSVAVTYFVGTGKWCTEVSETYRLDMQRVERGRRLKRRTFATATVSMLVVVLLAGLGAAADPGNSQSGGETWVTLHLIAAFGGVAFVSAIFWYQAGKVRANYELIQEIMADVEEIRDARGLATQ